MNSFRAVERAIAFEIERQAAALDAGEPLVQETRGWSDERGETYRMRVKETSDDYRYFPEPDLPPLHLDADWLAEIRAGLPELPGARRARYRDVLGLTPYDAAVLVADPDAIGAVRGDAGGRSRRSSAKPVANWVTGEYLRLRNAASGPVTVAPAELGAIVEAVGSRVDLAGAGPRGPRGDTRRRARPRRRSSPPAASARSRTADRSRPRSTRSWRRNPAAVADYRAGKAQAVGFLVGQVMKATRGQANAALVQAAVRERLEADRAEEG